MTRSQKVMFVVLVIGVWGSIFALVAITAYGKVNNWPWWWLYIPCGICSISLLVGRLWFLPSIGATPSLPMDFPEKASLSVVYFLSFCMLAMFGIKNLGWFSLPPVFGNALTYSLIASMVVHTVVHEFVRYKRNKVEP